MWQMDGQGTWMPPGALKKTLTTDIDGGTLPSWLSATDANVAASTTDPGGALITTSASPGIGAIAGASIDMDTVVAARLTVHLTRNVGTNMRIGFFSSLSGPGAYFQGGSGSSGVMIARSDTGVATTHNIDYLMNNGRRHHLWILLTPEDRTIYIGEGEGDDVYPQAHRQFTDSELGSAAGVGNMAPYISMQTPDATPGSFDLHQLTVERWWR